MVKIVLEAIGTLVVTNDRNPAAAAAAAAAKLLQSCPTLCDPIDSSPPGSPVPGILQARTLEWVAISFSNAWKWKVKVKLLSRDHLLFPLCLLVKRDDYVLICYQLVSPSGFHNSPYFSSVQSLSCIWLFVTPCTAASQASLFITKPGVYANWVMTSNHLILCCSLLLPPSIFPRIGVFSNESVLGIRWPKYWIFSFNISPSNEYSRLISFRMDWLDFFAVQGTLKSLLQHRSSKASVLQGSAFFIVQLLYPYITTEETIALTRQNFAINW